MDTTTVTSLPVVETSDGYIRGSAKFGFGFGSSWYEVLLVSAGATLALLTLVLYAFQCSNHIRHWRHPDLQKCYLRITMIAPIYGFFSWLSIARSSEAANFDTFRAMFEGYVLWSFFAMMMYGAGGELFFHRAYYRRNSSRTNHATAATTTEEEGNEDEKTGFLTNDSTQTTAAIPPTSFPTATTGIATSLATTTTTTATATATTTTQDEDIDRVFEDDKQLPLRCYFFPPMQTCGYCGHFCCTFSSSTVAINCWKICLIQFLILKPCLSMYTAWSERNDSAMQSDKFIKPMALLSVTFAMWALLSTYLALEPVSLSLRQLNVPSKFIVIKCAIFLTVAQELCFHILVASGTISSPYCWWAGPSEKCLDLMGFSTPSARRGIRTIACLVILEMFLLQFLLLKYYSFSDSILGNMLVYESTEDGGQERKKQHNTSITTAQFFFQPVWNIEPRSTVKNNNGVTDAIAGGDAV